MSTGCRSSARRPAATFSCRRCRRNKGLQLYAFVIMENHFHAVVHAEQLLACQPAEGGLPYGHVSCLLTRPYWATPCCCFPHCLLPNDAVMTSCVARCYKRGRLWAGFRLAYLDRSDRRHEKARPLHGSRAASLGLPEHISGGVVATPWIANGFRMRTSRVRLACASPTVPYKPAVRLLPRVIPALAVRRGSRR